MFKGKKIVAVGIALLTGAGLFAGRLQQEARAETKPTTAPKSHNLTATPNLRAASLLAALSDETPEGSAPSSTGGKDTLLLQGNRIADIAETAAPAVVNIEVEKAGVSGGLGMLPFGGGNYRFFFNNKEIDPRQMQRSAGTVKQTGSGFIVRPDGFILTNAHVVKGAKKIEVTMNDGRNLLATMVGIDTFSDLAVIKVDAKNLPTLTMGSSTKLRPGEFAIAIGSPLGYDHTVTLGIVSAVGRTVYDINDNINFIQTDAAINTGNSGGPLLNLKGEVIGVNTAVVKGFVAQNIGFSIPVDIAKSVCEDLINHKKILRPWLGIGMKEMTDTMAKSLGLEATTRGVVVAMVVEGSPAESAGLHKQDVIQKIDGKDMRTPKEVREYIRARKIEDTLNFFVLRNGSGEAIAVHLGEYPETGDDGSPQGGGSSDEE